MKLASLQAQFAQALHYQADGRSCDIVSDHFTADQHLQIYRNNFIISLTEVLSAVYPMTLALLGEECFTAMARHHILHHPLKQGDVSDYGGGFSATLGHFPQVLNAAPYAPDVARFEWKWDSVQQCFAACIRPAVLPLSQLHRLDEQQQRHIRLILFPWIAIVRSGFVLFSLKRAIENNQFEELRINQPEAGIISCTPTGQPFSNRLSNAEIRLLEAIIHGDPLASIEPDELSCLPALLELNLIAGFTLMEEE